MLFSPHDDDDDDDDDGGGDGEHNTSSSTDALLSNTPCVTRVLAPGLLELLFIPAPARPLAIRLAVDTSPGCGGVAWPAGQILAMYLVHRGPEYLYGRNALELGSGTGLVGLVAARLGAHVCITDQAQLLDTMRRNTRMNGLEASVQIAELDWAHPVPAEIPSPDIVLVADCVYLEHTFPLLVGTLARLTTVSTEVLLSYKKRRKADKLFFKLLRKHFTWTEVADDPVREVYTREAITMLRLCKRETKK